VPTENPPRSDSPLDLDLRRMFAKVVDDHLGTIEGTAKEIEVEDGSVSRELVGPEPTLPELASAANREHRLVGEAATSALEHAIRAGEALRAAKAQVEHGGWLPWLEENFDGSERTAQLYMQVAANPQRVADLDAGDLSLRAAAKQLQRNRRPARGAIDSRQGSPPSRSRHRSAPAPGVSTSQPRLTAATGRGIRCATSSNTPTGYRRGCGM
jgi:Protein of unknown function (DUF3102)